MKKRIFQKIKIEKEGAYVAGQIWIVKRDANGSHLLFVVSVNCRMHMLHCSEFSHLHTQTQTHTYIQYGFRVVSDTLVGIYRLLNKTKHTSQRNGADVQDDNNRKHNNILLFVLKAKHRLNSI